MNLDSIAGLRFEQRAAMVLAERSTSATSTHYRPDIDGLRAIAIGTVIVFHTFPTLLTGGFIGVDVFFVISGYLISQIIVQGLQAGTFSLAEFYRRRVRRILPALLLMMLACLLFGWWTLLPTELVWLGRSTAWCASFLANLYFARTGAGYFEKVEDLNPLLHLWSLGVEEQFYIVWPLLLLIAVKRRGTFGFLIAVFAASLTLSIWGAGHDPRRYFYFTTSRAWELAAGGILAAWHSRIGATRPGARLGEPTSPLGPAAPMCSIIGLALIAASAVFLNGHLALPGAWSLLPTAGAALLIAAGSRAPANRYLLANRAMVFLGRLSYPLYLWHWPVLSYAHVFLGRAPSAVISIVAMLLALLAAWATYRWIETPIRQGRTGRGTVALLLAALASLALTGIALKSHWLNGRLSGPPFAAWNTAVTDWKSPREASTDPHSGITTVSMTSRSERRTLFIGDSHLEHYWPRAQFVVDTHPDSARSALFLTYRGCPPMPGIEVTWHGRNCRQFFEYAIRRAQEPDVEAVVFGAFWEKLFIGEYGSQPLHGLQDLWPAPLSLDAASTRVAFEQFQQVIGKLVASGRHVFIVLSNPTSPLFEPLFPFQLRLALHAPRRLAEGPGVDSAPFEAFVAPVTNRLRRIAAETGAEVVDPRDALCNGTVCPSTGADGLPLYLDSNHLRSTYARERATFIDAMLLGPGSVSGPAP